MSKILSQDEIDALLNTAKEFDRGTERQALAGSVTPYNFRRPDRISNDQIRALQVLHDRFAHNVATSLSAYLRAITSVGLASVEQLTYGEVLASLPDPTAFYSLAIPPLDGNAALEVNPDIAFSMIDRMLGGSGRVSGLTRALTEIEQNVIDAVVKLIIENLTETWRGFVDLQFRVTGRETRPQMLHVATPNEVIVLLGFAVRFGDAEGMVNLCMPANAIASINTVASRVVHRAGRTPNPTDRKHLLDNLVRVTLPVAACIDTTLKARELLRLKPGDVVSLGVPVREPLDVRVRGSLKFRGRLTAVGRHAGVRIDRTTAVVATEAQ